MPVTIGFTDFSFYPQNKTIQDATPTQAGVMSALQAKQLADLVAGSGAGFLPFLTGDGSAGDVTINVATFFSDPLYTKSLVISPSGALVSAFWVAASDGDVTVDGPLVFFPFGSGTEGGASDGAPGGSKTQGVSFSAPAGNGGNGGGASNGGMNFGFPLLVRNFFTPMSLGSFISGAGAATGGAGGGAGAAPGGAGGMGGAGGGSAYLLVNGRILGSSVISSDAALAFNGASGPAPNGNGGGGGGGGAGGFVCIVGKGYSPTLTFSASGANGGAGGLGTGEGIPGSPGEPGGDGQIIFIDIDTAQATVLVSPV
jgi:hypothetical protein